MDTLTQAFATYTQLIHASPVIAGALSLYGLGVVTFLLRHVPAKLGELASTQLTTRLQLTNDDSSYSNAKTYMNLVEWYGKQPWAKYSRSFALNSVSGEQATLGLGNGTHVFWYKRHLFWLKRQPMEKNSKMYQINYSVDLTILGRNRALLHALMEEILHKPVVGSVGYYEYRHGSWDRVTELKPRALATVIVDASIKATLTMRIERFRVSRQWYEVRGIPYQLTFLLHGVPGTGKTSLVKAVASQYLWPVYRINLSSFTDDTLTDALSVVPEPAVILLEDVDVACNLGVRHELQAKPHSGAHSDEDEGLPGRGKLTLSGLLNALGGIVPLDGKVVFLTTNSPGRLDPALIRKGRVDVTLELPLLRQAEIEAYLHLMYPERTVWELPSFNPISGADLQDLYIEHQDNLLALVDKLRDKPYRSAGMGMV